MSDLIERLRDEGSRQNDWANDGESTVVGSGPELLVQAANEIELLRAHIEWIGANTDSPSIALYCHKALEDNDE